MLTRNTFALPILATGIALMAPVAMNLMTVAPAPAISTPALTARVAPLAPLATVAPTPATVAYTPVALASRPTTPIAIPDLGPVAYNVSGGHTLFISPALRNSNYLTRLLLVPLPRPPEPGMVQLYRRKIERAGKQVYYVKWYNPSTHRLVAGIEQPDWSIVPEALAGTGPSPSIDAVLEAKLRTAAATDPIPVVVTLAVRAGFADRSLAASADTQTRLDVDAVRAYQFSKQQTLAEIGLDTRRIQVDVAGTPFVAMTLTPSEIIDLSRSPGVLNLRSASRDGIRAGMARRMVYGDSTVVNALARTHMNEVHALGHVGGSPSNLAIWEAGTYLGVDSAARFRTASGAADSHATKVGQMAASFDLDSPLYDAVYDDEYGALNWVFEKAMPYVAINKSEGTYYADVPRNAEISGDDVWIDLAATRRLTAHLVLSAGNGQAGGYVLHHSFNTVKVGDSTGTGFSSWMNPKSPHGDREIPEIAAPSSGRGTSFAAPQVTGTLSVLYQFDNSLWVPQVARAVLFAGAWENEVDTTYNWFSAVQAGKDRRNGVGELDARESLSILEEARLGAGRGKGRHQGSLPAGGGLKRQDVTIRLEGTGKAEFRAAMAWNNDPRSMGSTDYDLYDLDVVLVDQTGRIRSRSATLDNNYELIQATIDRGQTYTLRVIGTKTPSAKELVYGLAWTSRDW